MTKLALQSKLVKHFCLIVQFSKTKIIKMVGKTGFEPATPWSQTKCSTKLSYFP